MAVIIDEIIAEGPPPSPAMPAAGAAQSPPADARAAGLAVQQRMMDDMHRLAQRQSRIWAD